MYYSRFLLHRIALLVCLALQPTLSRGEYRELWTVGSDDFSPNEFVSLGIVTNAPPGSAKLADNDYYLAGTYPAPIGTVPITEPVTNFQRGLARQNPRLRIHFPMTASDALPTAQFRLVFRTLYGQGNFDLELSLNGQTVLTRTNTPSDQLFAETFVPSLDGPLKAGENILQIRRAGPADDGYIEFDFLRLDIDPIGTQDLDGDRLPEWWESDHGMSDSNRQDALQDQDRDGLTTFQEYFSRTDPRNEDTDGDGVMDGTELRMGLNPLLADTDGDTLSDGMELYTHGTNPKLTDTDGDGFSDAVEVRLGTDPNTASSHPAGFSGAIGIQFVSSDRPGSALRSTHIAGVLPQLNWNVTAPLPLNNRLPGTHSLSNGNTANIAGAPLRECWSTVWEGRPPPRWDGAPTRPRSPEMEEPATGIYWTAFWSPVPKAR